MDKRLIFLERKHPTEYEVHVDKIEQDKNLLFVTKDKMLASDIVVSYNEFQKRQNKSS